MTSIAASLLVTVTLFISCGSPFHPSRDDAHRHAPRSHSGTIVFFVGTITSRSGVCPSPLLQIHRDEPRDTGPVQVVTSPDTIVTGQGGCAGLAPGARVEVEGNQIQDEVRADRIVLVSK